MYVCMYACMHLCACVSVCGQSERARERVCVCVSVRKRDVLCVRARVRPFACVSPRRVCVWIPIFLPIGSRYSSASTGGQTRVPLRWSSPAWPQVRRGPRAHSRRLGPTGMRTRLRSTPPAPSTSSAANATASSSTTCGQAPTEVRSRLGGTYGCLWCTYMVLRVREGYYVGA